MTEKEFDEMHAITVLNTGCHMLRNLYEDVRGYIPDELQESFMQLKMFLDDLRNPIYNYMESNRNKYIGKEGIEQ